MAVEILHPWDSFWSGFTVAAVLALAASYVYFYKRRPRRLPDPMAMEMQGREERFRQLIEHAPIAMLMVDAQGRIELVNVQSEQLFGYARDEIEHQPIELLLPERYRHSHRAFRSAFQNNPEARQMGIGRDLFARRKDGSEVPVEIGLNPIKTDSGFKTISSIIDLTERRRAEQILKEQAEQLAIANRYKSEFLANMSHELRTPLNSIMILSEQIKDNTSGNLTDKQVMHADIINRSGSDLLHLINDILDLSKIEAGRMTLIIESVELRDLVAEIDVSVRPQMDAKGLIFRTQVEDDVPRYLNTDHHRLYQVLKNLLSNAIKFTESGQVTVELKVQHGEDLPKSWKSNHALAFVVRDTGIGVPQDKQELIFHAFQQVEGSLSRTYGGTGLGLAICRQLMGLLEGDIGVDSHLGKGSVFTVWLPLSGTSGVGVTERRQPSPRAVSDGEGAKPLPMFSGRRVLLVDDDVRNVYATSAMLDQFGVVIEVAHDGAEALRLIESRPVDIVLMDISMPVMDGYTAIRILKGERHCKIPIIALTAYAMKGDREKCLQAGADDYVSKPVTRHVMQEVLTRWLV